MSAYPNITEWEIQTVLDFISYESKYGRNCEIEADDQIINVIEQYKSNIKNMQRISVPDKITECTACPTFRGCMTDFVCHTSPIENAIKIFDCGSLLSPVKARNLSASYLFKPYGIKYAKARKDTTMKEVKNIFVQVVEKPERRVVIKRGKEAKDYWKYCEEVGCDVWGLLSSIKCIDGEPVCLYLPPQYIKPGTSEYVQGAEVPVDYAGEIPEGFDVINLPKCKYIMFRGEPFEEADFGEAIQQVRDAVKKYDPKLIGYYWDDTNPRIQLEPVGTRGYIELYPVKGVESALGKIIGRR